jgi:hypothetical protein
VPARLQQRAHDADDLSVIARRARPLLVAAAVVLAASTLAGAAEPTDPTFQMTVSPAQVHLPGTTTLQYRLRIVTGSQAERFRVDAVPPLLRSRAGSPGFMRDEGATITPAQPLALEGPGTLTPIGQGIATIGCTPSAGLAPHGYEPRYPAALVELPAHSVSTIVARYRAGDVALWPGSDLRLALRVDGDTERYGPATLERDVVVRSPAVALSGRTAPRLELWTSPASSPAVVRSLRTMTAAAALDVRGRATKARAGRRVTLWLLRHGRYGKARRLGSVRTDGGGRLRLRTRVPARSGDYELWARTLADGGARAEHSCPIAFRVGA